MLKITSSHIVAQHDPDRFSDRLDATLDPLGAGSLHDDVQLCEYCEIEPPNKADMYVKAYKAWV